LTCPESHAGQKIAPGKTAICPQFSFRAGFQDLLI